ncbi:MAG: SRPBCC family protein [Gammaproteobacteria bacterium]|nr:SRPBCC family protein [Gammaproteobacteria bacterium]
MKFEETIIINAPAEKIFQCYENVNKWQDWDSEIQSASIEEDFQVGAIGKLKPQKGPEAKIEIIEITKPISFTVVSKLPLCLMTFEHHLVENDNQTEVTHAVSFTGVTAFLFGRLIGSDIKKGLPITLAGLKKFVELTK